jgi:type IV pilus assembly protein PilO
MANLVERVAKAPVGAKVAVDLAALALVTVLNYFVIGVPPGKSISAIEDLKKRREKELKDARTNLGLKQDIANDLNRFRRQRELLQQRLQEAKAELPDTNRIDDLLQVLDEKAARAGLEIAKVEPKPLIPASAGEFYARIPIHLELDGNFHEIATFLDALGHLQRIVNVTDIVLDTPKDENGRVVLKAKFTATTFMFDEPKAAAAPGKGKKVTR